MNNSYKEIWNLIEKQTRVTICTHINPDGDTVGSAVALKHLILDNTDIKEVKISGHEYPKSLKFLENNDVVSDEFFNSSLKIVVDTSTKRRIADPRVVTEESIKLDHHHHEGQWLMEIGGDHWPATGQVISEMALELGLKVSMKAQEGIFAAIWTDTEGLEERNPSKDTYAAIERLNVDIEDLKQKLAPTREELEDFELQASKVRYIDKLAVLESTYNKDTYRTMVGYVNKKLLPEVLVMFLEREDKQIHGELRSIDTDVSVFAKHLGGGGHKTSSGFMLKDKTLIPQAIKYISDNISN